ncbi:MAG: HD domain-containing protein [Chloroflexi bacterium]|nr:HD domain-containing protein [Chloroflexota bacterium]
MNYPAHMTLPKLTTRFEDALTYAAMLHAGQERKESGVPYIAHLLSVAALVLEDGGSEDEAIAALLHDAVEDQGGLERLRAIAVRYGEAVAGIVFACSDTVESLKPPWLQRKQRYIEHLGTQPLSVLRVSRADKLHNVRGILADYRQQGEALWSRFTGGRCGILWYYRALLDTYLQAGQTGYLVDELGRVVLQLEELAAAHEADTPAGGIHECVLGDDCALRNSLPAPAR